jgi:cytochrome c oxidase assembly factor CtaG
MTQHLVLADVAALALVLGLTGPLPAPVLRAPGVDRLRALAHPVPAFTLWAAALDLRHLPGAYQAALCIDTAHTVEHALFFWLGVNLWLSVFAPLPKPRWFTTWAKLGYVLAVRFTGTAALRDQSTAGAVMMIEETAISVPSVRTVVVLPAPLGPRKPKTSPCPKSNETSSNATRSPNRLPSPRAESAGPAAGAGVTRRRPRR